MNAQSIVIVTPARPGTRHGNRTTALRWAQHLRGLGHTVRVALEWDGRACDLMIALHARRSHASIKAWKAAHAEAPLILVLTGTDLYRDIRTSAEARESLALAERLVVLQPNGLDELDPGLRAKTRVIFQSVRSRLRREPPRSYFLVTVIGHLREEKDPFCAARALGHMPKGSRIRVVHLGKAMSPEFEQEALARMRAERRYRWLGERDHAHAMCWLARSHAMIISSRMEGGAHVVSEAIGCGVPVIASRIPGNVGLLGEGYRAYYPVTDAIGLADLLARAERDPAYLASLAAAVSARRALIDPETERCALRDLLAELCRPPEPA